MIYLDHAATTPLDPQVFEAMRPFLTEEYGNASSLYRKGQKARESLDESRFLISEYLECSLEEIICTSGATESINMALQGVVAAWKQNNPLKIPSVITSSIEHSAVKNTLEYLHSTEQIELCTIRTDSAGVIDIEELKNCIHENTALVSIIAVNNEVGTLQPISRIGRICEKYTIPFHVDAVQAVGQIDISVQRLKCDMLSLSAHKIYGPKGFGILYVRQGTEMVPLFFGGGQERNYRPGTENIAGMVGMAKALELQVHNWQKEKERLMELQKYVYEYITSAIPWAVWNGPAIGEERSTANVHFSFPGINGESLVMRLDLEGVAVSLGSACSSGMMEPSHVLLAMGKTMEEAQSGLRLTFGKNTNKKDLTIALEKIIRTVNALQS